MSFPSERRIPAVSQHKLNIAIQALESLIRYESIWDDPFMVGDSIERPLQQLKEAQRRIDEGEL